MDFVGLSKALLDVVGNFFGYKTAEITNIANVEVVEDKDKSELAIYHAKKAFELILKSNVKLTVKCKYHINKFNKYS